MLTFDYKGVREGVKNFKNLLTSYMDVPYRKPFKWSYVYIYASPILVHVERSVILQQQQKNRK